MGEVGVQMLQKDLLYSWICQVANKINSGIVILGADRFSIEYVNDIFLNITGYTKEEVIGERISILYGAHTATKDDDEFNKIIESSDKVTTRVLHYRKDGTGFWNAITSIPLSINDDTIDCYLIVMNDVTEVFYVDKLMQLEREVYVLLEQGYNKSFIFEQICNYVSNTFYKKNKCCIFLVEQNSLKVLTQSSIPEELKNFLSQMDLAQYLLDEKTALFLKEPIITTDIYAVEEWQALHEVMKKYNIFSTWSQPIKNYEDKVIGVFLMYFEEPTIPRAPDYTFLDRIAPIITLAINYLEQKSEILRLEFYDHKTGLRNIASFEKELNTLCENGKSGVVYIIEATEYQQIVDIYGRTGGNTLLRQIADRLNEIPIFTNSIIARYTTSSIIIETTSGSVNVDVLRQYINELIFEPYVIEDKKISITLKIGTAVFGEGNTGRKAIQQADTALSYAFKTAGTAIRFYDESQVKSIEQEMEVLTLFTKALKNKEFFPMLQPKVDISTGEVIGFEALARWISSEIGFVSPAVFIPVGEKTGNIYKVDRAILKSVLAWQHERKKLGKRLYPISVNISPSHFYYPNFVSNIEQLIKKYDVDPKYLTFEITESMELEDIIYAKKIITELKDIGIATSIDDFGVGYSSLSYLQELPFEEIKIDKSFTDSIAEKRMYAVVKTIIQLAADLNMSSVAEGVETEAQHADLQEIGCNHGQGYYYYKPMKLEEVDQLLEQYE